MKTIDVDTYKEQYLKEVEKRIIAKKDSIQGFTFKNLTTAMMNELNRADSETWEVDVPDDREQALKEAEERMIASMKENMDLGIGQGA